MVILLADPPPRENLLFAAAFQVLGHGTGVGQLSRRDNYDMFMMSPPPSPPGEEVEDEEGDHEEEDHGEEDQEEDPDSAPIGCPYGPYSPVAPEEMGG
eukprot:scaffold22671_cov118-Isochrysis_galbana.AAC.1